MSLLTDSVNEPSLAKFLVVANVNMAGPHRVHPAAEVLERGFALLCDVLADVPDLKVAERGHAAATDARIDAKWEISGDQRFSELYVEARARFTPRDVDRVLGGVSDLAREMMYNIPILVVAPWLSPRARKLLIERGLNYLDLTGNIYLRTRHPIIFVQLQGSDRDPVPSHQPPIRLKGVAINALIRILVDVAPPYRVTELAAASGLTPAYVSRSLETLDELRLVERGKVGRVVDVAWEELLRARAANYDLLRTNHTQTFIAPRGASELYHHLSKLTAAHCGAGFVVTGSFAAAAIAPVAAPTQLVLYTAHRAALEDPDGVLAAEGLLPADQGANVVILHPAAPSQLERPRTVDGLPHVGLSQLVLDCLTGNGRLPEEAEAVIEWMRTSTGWRLAQLPPPDPSAP